MHINQLSKLIVYSWKLLLTLMKLCCVQNLNNLDCG